MERIRAFGAGALGMWVLICLVLAWTAASGPAVALDLDTARAKEYVIEHHTGYLKAGPNASDAALQLVKSVNAKRRALYQDVAARDGVPLSSVETIFGDKIFAKGQPGLYERIDGSQIRK